MLKLHDCGKSALFEGNLEMSKIALQMILFSRLFAEAEDGSKPSAERSASAEGQKSTFGRTLPNFVVFDHMTPA